MTRKGTHLVNGIRNKKSSGKRSQHRVRIGGSDPSVTANAGMVGVTELVDRLDVIGALDGAIGPIKARDRGLGAPNCWSGSHRRSWPGRIFGRVRPATAPMSPAKP
jgi:hypothetical protein